MRFASFSLLVLLLTGCRVMGVTAARREAVQEAFVSQRFPLNVEEAARRMQMRPGVRTRCDRFPSGAIECSGCLNAHCFKLIDDQGFTRVATADAFTEPELRTLWQPLDPGSLEALRPELDDRIHDTLVARANRFEPRWGITAGVLAGLPTDGSALGVGGRLGVRRWFDVHFIGHAALEYRNKGDHELSLRVGLELSRWTEDRFWGLLGVPPASVSMFIGPIIRVPAVRGGLRTGIGLHLTDLRSVPLFAEAAAETTFAGEASRVAFTFTVGAGI